MTLCLCGSKAICAAVGENHREILRLVREAGLPAWKRGGRRPRRARPPPPPAPTGGRSLGRFFAV